MVGSSEGVALSTPAGNLTADTGGRSGGKYSTATPDSTLNSATVVPAGNTFPAAVNNVQPFLAMNYLICYNGQGS